MNDNGSSCFTIFHDLNSRTLLGLNKSIHTSFKLSHEFMLSRRFVIVNAENKNLIQVPITENIQIDIFQVPIRIQIILDIRRPMHHIPLGTPKSMISFHEFIEGVTLIEESIEVLELQTTHFELQLSSITLIFFNSCKQSSFSVLHSLGFGTSFGTQNSSNIKHCRAHGLVLTLAYFIEYFDQNIDRLSKLIVDGEGGYPVRI
mmetsp:Transcript_15372/g.28957  ORF Transcript_15372/g.28957 Transcript_15372/m.28957 type:complete len:203 (-) Transcript_15372:252-860(-)